MKGQIVFAPSDPLISEETVQDFLIFTPRTIDCEKTVDLQSYRRTGNYAVVKLHALRTRFTWRDGQLQC